MEEYHMTSLGDLSKAIITTSEDAMRKAIGELPDGTYRHEIFIDGFDEPIKVAIAITISGSELSVDFTGTSP
jgi:N-methylhydantoinase B